MRVLYIDDDPGLGRLVQRQLGRVGFQVEVETSGAAGLERLARESFDAVALDHYMPGQDGLDTLAAIRALPDPPPVVYVTGTQESRVAIAALKAGAADYVIKEVQGEFVELLTSALNDAIEKVTLRRARLAAEQEVREARDRFEALAAERALLLREMNHRVANSLQMITSLLSVQAGAAAGTEVKDALNAAVGRVNAVARVHRRLYTSEHVERIALDQYLLTLFEDLQRSSHEEKLGLVVMLASDPLELDADRATALGMLLSELFLNAAKYAYPGGEGPFRCQLRVADGMIHVLVEDDGVGASSESGTGLGSLIIRSMASKLGALLEFPKRERGFAVALSFPQFCETDRVIESSAPTAR